MNKTDLAAHVATRASLSRAEAHAAVGAVFATITEALAGGESVAIAGFGTFSTRPRPARRGRNPRTGAPIAIAASTTPSFKAGKGLRDAVSNRGGRTVAEVRANWLCASGEGMSGRPLGSRRCRGVGAVMFGAGRRRPESHPFSKRANMCADHARTLDACGIATPCRRR